MRNLVIPFVCGVAVTVAVYEATGIRLRGDRAPQVAANAPVSREGLPSVTSAPALAPVPAPQAHATGSDPAKLQADLSEAQNRAAFAEKQLEAVEGQAVPWPDDVAPYFKKEAVEQQLKEFVADRGLAKLKSINCTEYPCVEVMQLNNPDSIQDLQGALHDMAKRFYSGKVMISVQNTRVGSGSNAASYAGISIVPNDEDVRNRTRYRAKQELDEYSH